MAYHPRDLLISFLHDPPDKALRIPGHEERAARYASAAAGRTVTPEEIKGAALEDVLASVAERLPMPSAGPSGERAVSPGPNGEIEARHPISGDPFTLTGCALTETLVQDAIQDIVSGFDDPFDRFLLIWRLLPERLAARRSYLACLPADTRVPDHTIWHHLDTTAGLAAALSGVGGPAFLSFSLGPVQPFVAAARSVRDLWSGSAILSWLTFRAMLPLIEKFGPTAVIFPSLRGTPLFDLWLRKERGLGERVDEPSGQAKKAPCFPNRFLAVVAWGPDGHEAESLARQCRERAESGWKLLTEEVRKALDSSLSPLSREWSRLWDAQVQSFFEIRTSVLPLNKDHCSEDLMAELAGPMQKDFGKAFPNAAAVRNLADAIPVEHSPGYDQKHAGRWQAQVELSARLMEAHRSIRHVPDYHPTGDVPPKCSLMGSYEQMGPAGLQDSAKFWQDAQENSSKDGVRLRARERFCAVALTKRFAFPAFLRHELELDRMPFSDTATVAAAQWLEKAGIVPEQIRESHEDWNGQWLHWPRQDFDPDEVKVPDDVWKAMRQGKEKWGSPPAYYAILVMDADDMGQWLRGEKTPKVKVREVLAKKMVDYFTGLHDQEKVEKGLNAPRPVGPALHAAISDALTNFAVHIVPSIVAQHDGTLIYAGGDDVLALLPARSSLACARELNRAFRGEPGGNGGANNPGFYCKNGRDLLMMGPKATLSAGLAVVHYKEDLREGLEAARKAEKAAKNSGKDALQLAILRRSGEHASTLCSWDFVPRLEGWVQAFEKEASDRWAYHLRGERPILKALPIEAIQAEIRRQVGRAEEKTRILLGNGDKKMAGQTLADAFAAYHAMREKREKERQGEDNLAGRFLEDFITLCQSASFLARERLR
ncbi:MAG: type III-B CRISPR-associated protein Cas10/Cmr2 [Planctomycetes bacterium]|nr:type III-B CRISPR-associated protein Cas10/Cmr2 [Planctomycetota bacterium]